MMILRNHIICKCRNGDPVSVGDKVIIAGIGEAEVMYSKNHLAIMFDDGINKHYFSRVRNLLESVTFHYD